MSQLLREVLRERAEVGPAQVDVSEILRQGDRRIRHRRLATAGCAAGTAAVLSLSLLGPRVFDRPPPPADLPARFAASQLVYATEAADGTALHYGDAVFSVDVPVNALAATDYGFVLTTAQGDVWFTDGKDSEKVGDAAPDFAVSGSPVQVDDEGPLAAWVEAEEDRRAEVIVYDTHERREVARVAAAPESASSQRPTLIAVDDGAVYWNDGNRAVRYHVDGGHPEVLATSEDAWVWDVADGWILHRLSTMAPERSLVGRSIGSGRRLTGTSPWTELSPDGRFALVRRQVLDTRTNQKVSLRLPSRYPEDSPFEGTAWLDETTVVVWKDATQDGATGIIPTAILTCTVPSGTCRNAVDRPAGSDPLWRPVLPGYEPG